MADRLGDLLAHSKIFESYIFLIIARHYRDVRNTLLHIHVSLSLWDDAEPLTKEKRAIFVFT